MPYVIYAAGSGRKVGTDASLPADLAEEGLSATFYETLPDETVSVWDAAQRMYVPRPAPTTPILSQIGFTLRFTTAERRALHKARRDPATPLDISATLEDVETLVTRAKNGIDVTFEPTIEMVDGVLDILIYLGVVLPEAKATRKAAILAPVPV